MAEAENDTKVYLVRGALLACDKGSHPRRLNMPKSHGMYVDGHPVAIENDCGKDNIRYFGVCYSDTPPQDAETVRLEGYVMEGSGDTAEPVQGPKCCPDILEKWCSAYGQSVTSDSYLVCNCGGVISPITSGQEYHD